MKRILYIVLGVILLSGVVTLSTSVHAAPHPDPTPTPDTWLGPRYSCTKPDPGGSFGEWYCDDQLEVEGDVIGMITTLTKTGPRADIDLRHLIDNIAGGISDNWDDSAHIDGDVWNTPWCFERWSYDTACEDVGYSGDQSGSTTGDWADPGDMLEVGGHYQWGEEGWTGDYDDITGSWTVTVQLIYSGDECEDPDPTELPVAASGTLAGDDDTGDHYSLEEGTEYFIYTSGGPWNDGVVDRYDIAVSWDEGETWEQLGSGEQFEGVCSYDYSDHSAFRFTADSDHSTIDLRVNDVDGEFGDNTGDIDYTIAANEGSGGLCSNYYSAGSLIQSGTVDADEELGSSMSVTNRLLGPMYAYDTYLIKILDPWQEGDGTDQLGTEMQEWSTSFWEEMATFGDNTCEVEYAASKDIYFIGPSEWGMYEGSSMDGADFYIRAEDIDGLFSNNMGTFDWQLLGAEYTAPESDCAASFDKGPLIESRTVNSAASNGVEFPLSTSFTPGQVYVIENADSSNSHYSINGSPEYNFEISPDGDTWYDMETFAECTNPLDHMRSEYYFIPEQDHYFIRTEQGLPFVDEVDGSLYLNLYGSSDKRAQPGELCSDLYETSTEVYSGSVDASDPSGEAIGSLLLEEGQLYSIQIDDPPYDQYGFDVYNADINRFTGVGPESYEPFETWGGALCYEEGPLGQGRLYFEAQSGQYEIRASGPHEDNTGNLNYTIYTTAREEPNHSGCEITDYGHIDDWYLLEEIEVDATDNNPDDPGEFLKNNFDPNKEYKFVVSGGPAFLDHGTYGQGINPSYDLEISYDNGNNWQPLDYYLDCVVEDGNYIRGYLSSHTIDTGPYRVRVYDPDNSYINNAGSLILSLYSDTPGAHDPVGPADPTDPNFPGGWGEGCTAVCVRPGSWLQAGQWVEYIRCRFTRYISWCPYHTDRLASMRQSFYAVEPFGTILEVIDTAGAVQAEVSSYQWTDEGGGGADTATVQAPRHFVFAPGEGGGADIPLVGEDTIWGSGSIDLTPGHSPYSTACNNLMAESLGDRLSQPLCFTFNVVNQLGLKTWIQWLWDMAMIFAIFLYLNNKWIDLMT